MNKIELSNPYQTPILIYAQASYYPNMISVYIPKSPIVRRPQTDSKNSLRLNHIEDDADAAEKESNLERSIRRTKKQVRDYGLCNDFDMFATFTFALDRQNADRVRQQMLDWLHNQRNRNGKFKYLVIPEFHKDGESLHFHALLGDYSGKIEPAISPNTNKPLVKRGRAIYQLSGYTLGFTNVKLIGKTLEDTQRTSAYLTKYVTKEMPLFHGKQRYWASKGLALPKVQDNPEEWYKHVKPDWQVETENGTIMRFNIGHPLSDIYWEANH